MQCSGTGEKWWLELKIYRLLYEYRQRNAMVLERSDGWRWRYIVCSMSIDSAIVGAGEKWRLELERSDGWSWRYIDCCMIYTMQCSDAGEEWWLELEIYSLLYEYRQCNSWSWREVMIGAGEKWWLDLERSDGGSWKEVKEGAGEKWWLELERSDDWSWREMMVGAGEKWWLELERSDGWSWRSSVVWDIVMWSKLQSMKFVASMVNYSRDFQLPCSLKWLSILWDHGVHL